MSTYLGRIKPFCDACQFADWDDAHEWPCECRCHAEAVRTRPVAERAADWRAGKAGVPA